MSKLSRVLLIENTTPPGSPAYQRAVALAERSGAELLICQVVYDPLVDYTTDLAESALHRHVRSDYMLERQRPLDLGRQALLDKGLRVSTQIIWSPAPHEAIIAKAIEFNPDIVVANLERRRDMLGMYVTTAEVWKLARLCPAPLMLVHAHCTPLPTRITVALDTADALADAMLNEQAIDVARYVAGTVDLPLDLIHVFPMHQGITVLQESYEKKLLRDQHRLQKMADEAGIPSGRCHWRSGFLSQELYNYVAGNTGDLMVLGSAYHNSFSRLFLGSTTEDVIGNFPCDVLLIKPAGFLRELSRHKDLNVLCDSYGVKATELLDAA